MAVTPKLGLELFSPLGVGWREDATCGALLDYNMLLIDEASGGGGSVSSVFGRAGTVVAQSSDYAAFFDAIGAASAALTSAQAFATSAVAAEVTNRNTAIAVETSRAETAEGLLVPQTTTVNGHALSGNVVVSASNLTTGTLPHAQLPALLSGDIPNIASMVSTLPNVKVVPVFKTFATGGPFFDYYTVPAGRRALLSNVAVSSNMLSVSVVHLLKVSGAYYIMGAAGMSATNNGTPASTAGVAGYIAEAGETFSLCEPWTTASWNPYQVKVVSVAAASATSLTLSSAFTQINGLTEYVGTITGGASNAFQSMVFVVAGFTNAGNNGTFLCVASTATTLTLQNIGGVAETHAGTAAYTNTIYTFQAGNTGVLSGALVTVTGCTNSVNNGTFVLFTGNGSTTFTLNNPNGVLEASPPSGAAMAYNTPASINAFILEFDNTSALRSSKLLGAASSTAPQTLYTPSGSKTGLLVNVGNVPTSGSIFMSNGLQQAASAYLYYNPGATQSHALTSATAVGNGMTAYAGVNNFGHGGASMALTNATVIGTSFAITSCGSAGVGGTTYTGTFPLASCFVGQTVTITGFANAANNGTFYVTSNTTTTMVVFNIAGVAQTLQTATATIATGYTVYTAAASTPANYYGQYWTITGFAAAGNNGTFKCFGGTAGLIYVSNTGGTTQAATATATLVPLYGATVTVAGFSNSGNNGSFTCVGSTGTALILSNSGGVAETKAATASYAVSANANLYMAILNPGALAVSSPAVGFNNSVANGDSLQVLVQFPVVAPPGYGFSGMLWCNVMEF